MRSRLPSVNLFKALSFLPAGIAFLASIFVAHPAAAVLLLVGDACLIAALTHTLGFGARHLLARGIASLFLLIVYAALADVVVGYPLLWLLRDHSLPATLALSTTCVIALLSLWKFWPSFAMACMRKRYSRVANAFSIASRSLSDAKSLTSDNEIFFDHGLVVSIAMLVLVIGAAIAIGIGGASTGLPRWASIAVYAAFVAPALCLIAIERTGHALLLSARRHREHSLIVDRDESLQPATDLSPEPEHFESDDFDAMLLRCVRAGQTHLALAAIERGANPNTVPPANDRDQRSVVELACMSPDMRLLRGLIAKGADLNRSHAGLPPLIAATRDSLEGRPDAVMTLLTNGADPRCADSRGNTPLHCAALCEKPILAALLCDAGAPMDAVNGEGLTPLGVACESANWDLVRFLLERGAKIESEHGQPAISAAASVDDDDPQGVKLLIKRKARVDARGPLKRTALMTAAMHGNAFIAQTLLDAGAAIDLADAHGATALMEAARAGASDVLDVFASRQPSLDIVDARGRSALIIACQSSKANEEVVRRLLDMGASRDVAAPDGKRAVDFAAHAGRWNIVALIDPDFPRPQTVAEPCAQTPELSADHLLDALRFGHWNIVDRFGDCVREWPQAELGRLFIELMAHDDAEPRRWLLTHGLAAETQIEGVDLLARTCAGLPSTLAAARDLLDAGAPCGGASALAYICRTLPDATDRAQLESLALRVIERGADIFSTDADGASMLSRVVDVGSEVLTRALLERGADPNSRDSRGRTPLFGVFGLANDVALRITQQLLIAGANPDVSLASGETPLGLALARGNSTLHSWLNWFHWKLPARPLRGTDVLDAAACGDASAVDKLITLGLPIDFTDAQGATPLLRAAGKGHASVVGVLIDRGADVTRTASTGATALSAAVIARHASVVDVLLAKKVAVDQRLKGGGTALMIAAALGYPDVVATLLNAGANVDAADDSRTRALHAATHFAFHSRDGERARQTLDALIARGATIDARNSEAQTPLLLLLGAHAEAGARADQKQLLELMPLFLDRHADLNAADNRGVTALHACAMHGLLSPARALIAAGADTQLRDMRERTPREVAHILGFIDVAAELGSQRSVAKTTTAPSLRKSLRDFD